MRTSSRKRRAYLGSWLAFAMLGLGRAATGGATPAAPTKVVPQVPAPSSQTLTSDGAATPPASTCVQDDPVLTPRNWHGWDRSAVIAWEAVEQAGGIVPEIEEDGTQAPPRWWRYPSALRSAALLAAEAKNARGGLYDAVAATALAKGDILVRTVGAGVCGKMAVLGGKVEGQWLTIEVDPEDGHARPVVRAIRCSSRPTVTLCWRPYAPTAFACARTRRSVTCASWNAIWATWKPPSVIDLCSWRRGMRRARSSRKRSTI